MTCVGLNVYKFVTGANIIQRGGYLSIFFFRFLVSCHKKKKKNVYSRP